MTASALIGFALVLVIAVIAAVVITTAAIGKKQAPRRAGQLPADEEPTGYVPGVWLLGGDESAAPRGHHHAYPDHGQHHDGHGVDAGGAHGADAGTGDAGGDSGGGSDGGSGR